MLIRSQDKKSITILSNAIHIYVVEITDIFNFNKPDDCSEAIRYDVKACNSIATYILGSYSNEAKAISVLGKICKCYENYQATPQSNAVFDMPADEDVDE